MGERNLLQPVRRNFRLAGLDACIGVAGVLLVSRLSEYRWNFRPSGGRCGAVVREIRRSKFGDQCELPCVSNRVSRHG